MQRVEAKTEGARDRIQERVEPAWLRAQRSTQLIPRPGEAWPPLPSSAPQGPQHGAHVSLAARATGLTGSENTADARGFCSCRLCRPPPRREDVALKCLCDILWDSPRWAGNEVHGSEHRVSCTVHCLSADCVLRSRPEDPHPNSNQLFLVFSFGRWFYDSHGSARGNPTAKTTLKMQNYIGYLTLSDPKPDYKATFTETAWD